MNSLVYMTGSSLIVSSAIAILGLVYCYGAARLSYTYNMYIQNTGYAFLWALICFFFPYMYYPYYAIMLNPVAGLPLIMTGGKRKP